MTLSFQRWGLGAKLSFLTGVAVAALFLLFTFALSHKASEQLEALALEDLHNQTTSVVDMAQMFDSSLNEEVASFTKLFNSFIPQPISLLPVAEAVQARVARLFDLDFDPTPMLETLGPLAASRPGLRLPFLGILKLHSVTFPFFL